MAEDEGGRSGRRAGIVTLLFTDLVASTELLDRLGDEQFERLRRIHFQLLREAVAASGGEEVKNLGDGLMVVFPSALDAIGCAVAMQQAVALHNAEPDVAPISVRVGLHAGEPIVEEDDYFGTPVVVAKRLCDRAEGGQILVSDLVAALVGGRRQFSFREIGDVELKGLGKPMATREVVWRDDGDASSEVIIPPPPPPSAHQTTASGAPLPPLPPPPVPSGGATGSSQRPARWKRIAVGVLAVIGALSLLYGIFGGGNDNGSNDGSGDAPRTSDSPGGRDEPRPSDDPRPSPLGEIDLPAAGVGFPDQARTFAQGRIEEDNAFFLFGEVTPNRAGRGEDLPLDLREGEVVTIGAETDNRRAKPFLELYGPGGELATFDIDAGGEGTPVIYRWMVPASGQYAVRLSTLGRGVGPVKVFARSELPENPTGEPDSFGAAVVLSEQRPEAAWRWDIGDARLVIVRVVPNPENPMLPILRLENGDGEVKEMLASEMEDGTAEVELPQGGQWELVITPTEQSGPGAVNLQVWIPGQDRPQPEMLR